MLGRSQQDPCRALSLRFRGAVYVPCKYLATDPLRGSYAIQNIIAWYLLQSDREALIRDAYLQQDDAQG